MSEYLTFLLTELSPRDPVSDGGAAADDPVEDAVHEAVLVAGGAIVAAPHRLQAAAAGGALTAAVFHLAGDAARTAVQLTGALAGERARSFRMALCTGDAHATGATLGGPALGRAAELLRLAGPRQVLVTASTAVAASPTLPRGAELVDRGARALGRGHPPERVYELRAEPRAGDPEGGDPDGPPTEGAGASNLDWARRAVHGPVLGRDEPLTTLESAWKRTLTGDRRTVLLVGDGGIGKTTVAAELALRVHAEGALVLYGRWDQGSLAPYQAVREALGTYANGSPPARLRADLDGRSDEIARLLPDVVARIGGVRAPLRGDPDGERLRLFDAIEGWLDLLARRRPVLLVLDDLHWAGRSSLQLVEHLRRHRSSAPLMVVITLREGETPQDGATATAGGVVTAGAAGAEPSGTAALLAQAIAPGDGVERIDLEGLDRRAIARLIEQVIGRPLGPDDELVEWLTHDTAGNPLFVQVVLRSVTGSSDASAALRAARRELPEQLTGVVGWRLGQLPHRTVEVLTDAALLGASFELDLLAAARGAAPVVLGAPLDAAVQAGLLRAQGDRYAFAHEVVRRVLHDRLDPERAAGLHRRVAAALGERARAGQEVATVEVADHHLRGADPSTARQAVRWARAAAEAARRETAFESAVNLLRRAVEVHDRFAVDDWFVPSGTGPGPGPGGASGPGPAPGPGPGPGPGADSPAEAHESHSVLACELRLELAEAHDRAGEFAARDRRHLEAADLARALDDTELFTRAALGFRGRLPAATPPDPEARRLLHEALDRLPADDSRRRALLLSRLAQVRHFDASYDERRAGSDEAVAMARRLDNPVVLATVLMARCLTLDGPEDVVEQLAISTEIIRIGERTGDPDLVLQGARVRTTALLILGRHDEAETQADTLITLAQQVRHPDHLRIATMWDILWAMLEGRYAEADALVEQLRGQLVAAGHLQSRSIYLLQTFPKIWLQGIATLPRPPGGGELPAGELTSTSSWAIATWVEAITGREEQALARLAGQDPSAFVGSVPRDYMWWPTMILLVLSASSGQGDPSWARVLRDTLLPYEGRNCLYGFAAFAGAVDHHLGTLALVTGDGDEAIERLEIGLSRHRELAAAPFVALSARWLAHALARRGAADDQARAVELRQESRELADRLGLQGLPDFDAGSTEGTDSADSADSAEGSGSAATG